MTRPAFWWDDLSDDELEARLTNRRLPADRVTWLIAERDDDDVAATIHAHLEGWTL